MKLRIITATVMACALFSPASYSFFCPENFTQINAGDTLDQVQALCGEPDTKVVAEMPEKDGPQVWDYYVPQTAHSNSGPVPQGALKTSIAFDGDGKVINMSVNGVSVGATAVCGGSVSLGDTRDYVKNTCGKPPFVTKTDASGLPPAPPANSKDPATKHVEWTYLSNPPVTLIFEGGRLVGKK